MSSARGRSTHSSGYRTTLIATRSDRRTPRLCYLGRAYTREVCAQPTQHQGCGHLPGRMALTLVRAMGYCGGEGGQPRTTGASDDTQPYKLSRQELYS